jgi:hypothetical protein
MGKLQVFVGKERHVRGYPQDNRGKRRGLGFFDLQIKGKIYSDKKNTIKARAKELINKM